MFFSPVSLFSQQNNGAKAERYVLGWVSVDSVYHGMPMARPDEQKYRPDSGAVAELATWRKPTEILVFFGSWCGDSKRELPRFLAALHGARNDFFSPRYLGLDRSKKDGAGMAEQYHVTNIPTFVFIRDGQEIGRIVEKPVDPLEREWANILRLDPARRDEVCRLMHDSLWPAVLRAATNF